MKIILYQPGNGTRYHIFFHKIDDSEMAGQLGISSGGWLVGEATGMFKTYAFQPIGILHSEYIMEKLGISNRLGGDGDAITNLMSHIMGRPLHGQTWIFCKECGLPIAPHQEPKGICVTCEFGW